MVQGIRVRPRPGTPPPIEPRVGDLGDVADRSLLPFLHSNACLGIVM